MNLKLTRRDFLKGTTAAAAIAVLPKYVKPKDLGNGFFETHKMMVGLGTEIPGGITEVSGGGYQRQGVDFEARETDFKNTEQIFFPQATSTWGTISHAALFADDELVAVVDFGSSFGKHISNGDTVAIDNICIEVN